MLFSSKDLRKLIIPLMFEQLLAVLVGLVDTLMVSQSGEAAVAGVALVDNINRLIIQVMAALATGGAVVCSQYIGKGRDDESRKSGAQLETVLLIFSVIMTAFSVSFTRPLLKMIFGTVEESVMDCAVLYFMITALSYPFLGMYNAGAAIFRSVGNSKVSMNISILMNVINVAGNALFVFVFKWSVAGVALSTALSRGFFLMLSYLVTNTTLNIDRLVIRQVLGNEQVTWYYVTSLIGKTLVLLIAPINTIVISYLTKRKERLTRLQYGKAALAGGIVSFVFFLACQVGTPLFVWLFYRNLYDSVKGIVTVVNLAQILGLYSAFLFILVLTFTDERWQLGIQLAHFVILLAVSIPAAKIYGLEGFAYASLGANILRVAAVIILGLVKAQNGKESKDEYR